MHGIGEEGKEAIRHESNRSRMIDFQEAPGSGSC
jgi:hypothetical protein